MNKKRIALSLVLFIALVATIVALMRNEKQPDGDTGGKLAVIASYYPLYDFAKQVGGNKAVVTSMTPAGAEPHDYEPAPRTLARTLEADVFIYNGGHMAHDRQSQPGHQAPGRAGPALLA
jgi:zinc transport system substrate-binding protein